MSGRKGSGDRSRPPVQHKSRQQAPKAKGAPRRDAPTQGVPRRDPVVRDTPRREGVKPAPHRDEGARPRNAPLPPAEVSIEDELPMVCGVHPVDTLLKTTPERINRIAFLAEGRGLEKLVAEARKHHIPFDFQSRARLDQLAEGARHQGVVARVAPFAYADLSDILARAKADPPGLIVVLDEVADPRNLGAVVRSAEAAGAHGVIVPRRRAAPLTASAAKAAAGAFVHLPVARVDNLARTLEKLKGEGFWIYGLDGAGEPLYQADMNIPVVLVAGGEGSGLRPLVAKGCDRLLAIPLKGKTPSLNVSVATAVALFAVQAGRDGRS
ncbi:MAG: 23S rRNA (guanosine(2251)-2'-O)-methyltransferase RlmB [Nitrospirota bacterium]|nr:23S rRNA (guanosine(2251)-2'-O)-methyltransferase RlmB [Nitrospirota bacterium]